VSGRTRRRLPSLPGGFASGLAGAALAVALVTAVARIAGAARVAVLGQTVGPTCLGDTYATANLVPNVAFEVVAGGALASLVVPVVAGAVAAGDVAAVRRTASALLTWTVLLLVPVGLAVLGARELIMSGLLGSAAEGCDRAEQVALGARMLAVFAPQVVLYGIAIVLAGVLQAHRRFLGPAVAPLVSSLVVIAALLTYATRAGRGEQPLQAIALADELTLSIGTTLGVAMLAGTLLVPLARTGVRLRPGLSFPPGVARRVRGLALAGSAVLVAQQASVVVVLRLLNDGPPRGSVVVFTLATTVFLVPWAVLAVPVATSAFPRLAAQFEAGNEDGYATTASTSVRLVLLVTALSASALAVAATPAARVLVLTAPGRPSVTALADALVAYAPGLVGYGLVALLGRALYARGAGRAAATATVAGWTVVIVADVVLVAALPPQEAVRAVALGNTIGMSVAGVLLVRAVRRETGGAALRGTLRTALTALGAAAAATVGGLLVVLAFPAPGPAASLGVAVGAAAAVLAVFTAVAAVGERPTLQALLRERRTRA
jgi:putative peptidoglycan lipid II flippase